MPNEDPSAYLLIFFLYPPPQLPVSLSLSPHIYPSPHLPVSLSLSPHIYPPPQLPVSLSLSPHRYSPPQLPVSLSLCPHMHPPPQLPVSPSLSPHIYPLPQLQVSLSVSPHKRKHARTTTTSFFVKKSPGLACSGGWRWPFLGEGPCWRLPVCCAGCPPAVSLGPDTRFPARR